MAEKENIRPGAETGTNENFKQSSIDGNCRVCECNFNTKYGKPRTRISTENLFVPSRREGSRGTVLATLLCEVVGITCVKSDKLSSRVCNSCGRKIRNLAELYRLVQSAFSSGEKRTLTGTPQRQNKRCIDSTPGRSPARKLSRANSPKTPNAKPTPRKTSRKSLFQSSEANLEKGKEDHHLNVNGCLKTKRRSKY